MATLSSLILSNAVLADLIPARASCPSKWGAGRRSPMSRDPDRRGAMEALKLSHEAEMGPDDGERRTNVWPQEGLVGHLRRGLALVVEAVTG